MDEKQANEIGVEERWTNFQNAKAQGDWEMCTAIMKEARQQGFDALADEMALEYRKSLPDEIDSD